MRVQTFDFISDPGHAWLKVPVQLLRELGIADQITSYSYWRKGFAYLEEDCDASVFFNAYRARFGADPKFRERNRARGYSKVRGYEHYSRARANPLASALQASGQLQFISIGD